MKKWLILLTVVSLAVVLTCPASAKTTYIFTFDDVAIDKTWGTIPDDYQGFEWHDFGAVANFGYQKGFNNSIIFPSPTVAVFNGNADDATGVISLANATPFLLEGAYFSAWAKDNKSSIKPSKGLTVIGYLNGEAVGSSKFSLTPQFVWQDFNFGPVDLVEFMTQEHNDKRWWLMDNVQVSAVHIPATIGMFCGGLLALGIFGRRRVVN
jgi:hypothetical protein